MHVGAQKSKIFADETRFLVAKHDEGDPKAKAYSLPETGLVTCTVSVGHPDADFVRAVSAETLDGLLAGLQSMSDSGCMLETALLTMKLRLPEATQVLRALLKEGGNVLYALELLVPRMATTVDTLQLLASCSLRIEESHRLKQALGWGLYRTCTGMLTGFYSLALDR